MQRDLICAVQAQAPNNAWCPQLHGFLGPCKWWWVWHAPMQGFSKDGVRIQRIRQVPGACMRATGTSPLPWGCAFRWQLLFLFFFGWVALSKGILGHMGMHAAFNGQSNGPLSSVVDVVLVSCVGSMGVCACAERSTWRRVV